MVEFVYVENKEEYLAAVALFREYSAWLGIDLGFQKFDKELQHPEIMYGLPSGGIILCKIENSYIGCVAIREQDKDIAELKRMYVKPGSQGLGIGSKLLGAAILLAKKLGYKKIRLDTLSFMKPAIELYKKNGFVEISAYYYNPQKTAVFFERDI